jgi:hypothetical protein
VVDKYGEDDGNDGQPIEHHHTAEDLLQAPASMSIHDQIVSLAMYSKSALTNHSHSMELILQLHSI